MLRPVFNWCPSKRLLVLVALALFVPGSTLAASGTVSRVPVAVFPIAGSHYNRPTTQITFRGVGRGAIGRVLVRGSRTGVHTGRLEADSDGNGASFLPRRPFRVGETVTVTTRLNVIGGRSGRFSFAIGNVAPLIKCANLGGIPRGHGGDIEHFLSRPDLHPVGMRVTADEAPASEGDIFVGPQNGPKQNGPMIVDHHGGLVWFLPTPVSTSTYANDFRVADLHGQPVLSWWHGCRNAGIGRGAGVIMNRSYQRIATVHAANGLAEDSHELLVTPQGDAFITAVSPVWLHVTRPPTIDWVVQEIDLKTGLVLFEWHALDHVPLSASWVSVRSARAFFDPYHLNSISLRPDGNVLVSMRNTNAEYLIDRQDGHVIWTLGGKDSSFTMGSGTRTWAQHNAVLQPDGTVTSFDNGGGPPFVHPQSRGVRVRLDTRHMTATLIREYDHAPSLSASVEGGLQLLADGNAFIGWGADPYMSEYDAAGRQIFDAHFDDPIASYRAFRFNWSAQPATRPAAAAPAHGASKVYASWNGATDVATWRVLGGSTQRGLAVVASAAKTGFETAIQVPRADRWFAVQAMSAGGRVLATSRTVKR